MKIEHAQILKNIKEYLNQPGADQLRFWQALYGMGIIKGDLKPAEAQERDIPSKIIEIRDDFNISDEELLERMK